MTAAPLPDLSIPPRTGVRALDLLMVAVITAAVFMPNLYGRLSPLDDYVMLASTEQFKNPSWAGYANFWFAPPFKIFMPLTLTVWQVIAHFEYRPEFEPNAWAMGTLGFKAASIITHALSAAAATWVVSVFTRFRWPAIVGGLVFALHPVQVESVCWTTGLKDELCGLFAILSIGFYRQYLYHPPKEIWKSKAWIAAVVAALLAMLSKPTGAMLAVSVMTIDLAFRRAPIVKRLPALWMFFAFALVCAQIAHALQPGLQTFFFAPLWSRPLTALDAVAFYLAKIVLPIRLAQDYGRYPEAIIQSGQIYWTWLLPMAVGIVLLLGRSRMVLVAAALFVIPILPVSGLVRFDMQQFSTTADHYLYQPMLGVALLVAVAMGRWKARLDLPAVVVLCVLGALSWQGANQWRRPQAMFEDMLQKNPHSWLARAILAGISIENGDMAYSKKLIDELKAEHPESGDAEKYSTLLFIKQGRYAEAADMARKALAKRVESVIVARDLLKIGAKFQDREMALEGVRAWLMQEPGNPAALHILADLRRAGGQHPPTTAATSPAVP